MRLILSRQLQNFCNASSKIVTLKYGDKKTARLSLTNPKKRNTLSSQAIAELKNSLTQIEQKIKQKQTKVRKNQIKDFNPLRLRLSFCSGHDLKQLGKSSNPKQIFDSASQLMLQIRNLPIPTLCLINGVAAAAGFQMALACDLIIASQKSSFSTPGVKWGLFCSTPAVELIRACNSEKKAMEMLLFGQSISAQEAYHYGLVNKVVPQDKLEQTVSSYVEKVNNLSGQVIAHGKTILRNQRNENIEKAYCIAGEGMHKNITQKQDCKEGIKAFSEKKHPHYKN